MKAWRAFIILVDLYLAGVSVYEGIRQWRSPDYTYILWLAAMTVFLQEFAKDIKEF